jgi:hypothetical protein
MMQLANSCATPTFSKYTTNGRWKRGASSGCSTEAGCSATSATPSFQPGRPVVCPSAMTAMLGYRAPASAAFTCQMTGRLSIMLQHVGCYASHAPCTVQLCRVAGMSVPDCSTLRLLQKRNQQ